MHVDLGRYHDLRDITHSLRTEKNRYGRKKLKRARSRILAQLENPETAELRARLFHAEAKGLDKRADAIRNLLIDGDKHA